MTRVGLGMALALALGAAVATPTPASAAEIAFGPQEDAAQSFIVPPGVFYMKMTARGAGGEQGDSDTGRPGRGALLRGNFEVTPGEELLVYVARGNGWGYAEGGDRGEVGGKASDGAGGGGATAVLLGSTGRPLLIAGGGGGAGGDDGGESEGGAGGDAGRPEARSGGPGRRGHDPVPEKVEGGCGGCEREGGGGKGDGVSSNLISGGGGGGGGGGLQGGAGGEDGTINLENNQASGAGGGGGSSFITSGTLDPAFTIYTGCEEREGEDCEGYVTLSWGAEATQIAAVGGNGQRVRATQPYGTLTAKVTNAEGVPVYSAPVTFTVPSRGAGGVLPGGGSAVTVYTNGQGLATLNGLLANGIAGPWALEASIGGAPPALFTLENEAIATTVAIVSSLDPATALESPEFTATIAADVAESTLPPRGEVAFTIDGAPIVPAVALGADGTARLAAGRVPFLGAGEHIVTARYLGDAGHAESLATMKETVTTEPTALTVEANPNPAASGEGVDLTARIGTVPALTRAPTGEVTFTVEGASVGSAGLNAEGVAVLHTTAGAVGSHRVVATYAGDETFAAAGGETFESVGEAATATVLAATADPSVFGAGTEVRATVVRRGGGPAPVGTVNFSVDGQPACAAVALVAAVAKCPLPVGLGAGVHVVEATYAPGGGSADQPSVGSLRQVVVAAPTSAALTVSPVPSLFGQATALRATVTRSGGAPATGAVAFVLDGVELGTVPLEGGVARLAAPCEGAPILLQCPLAPGAHLAEALFVPAGADLRPSRASAFAHVDDDPTVTTVATTEAGAGEPVTFSAQVSSGSGRAPRGAVQFLVDGVALGDPAAVVRGVATSTETVPAAGLHRVVGHFIGAGEFADSEGAAEAITPAPSAAAPAPKAPAPTLQLASHTERVDGHGRFTPRVTCVGAPGQVCTGTVRLVSVTRGVLRRATKRDGRRVPTLWIPAGTELASAAVAIPAGTTAPVAMALTPRAGRLISANRTLAAGVDLATGSVGPILRLRATDAPRLAPLAAVAIGGEVAVRVRCARGAGATPCRGDLRLFAGGVVGRATVKLAAGATRRVLVPTPRRRGARILVRARSTLLPVGHPRVTTRSFEVGR